MEFQEQEGSQMRIWEPAGEVRYEIQFCNEQMEFQEQEVPKWEFGNQPEWEFGNQPNYLSL